jgi:hypothetical protein
MMAMIDDLSNVSQKIGLTTVGGEMRGGTIGIREVPRVEPTTAELHVDRVFMRTVDRHIPLRVAEMHTRKRLQPLRDL